MRCTISPCQLTDLRLFKLHTRPVLRGHHCLETRCGATSFDKEKWRRQLRELQQEGGTGAPSSSRTSEPEQRERTGDGEQLRDQPDWLKTDLEDEKWEVESGLEDDADSTLEAIDFGWSVEDLDDEEQAAEPSVEASEGVKRQSKEPQEPGAEQRRVERLARWTENPAMSQLPRHMLDALQEEQEEADRANRDAKKAQRQRAAAEAKTHKRLRIVRGAFAGRRLLSGKGDSTRPMMEVVRAAAFDMLQSRCGTTAGLPEGTRWLDLFAGTGSVGLEALSRGVEQCCFIELDRWVVSQVLMPNLDSCNMMTQSLVHTMKAEDYLAQAKSRPEYHPAFDFISVCPPYLKVSYEELFELLDGSPLLHEETHVLVEYPRKSRGAIPQALGPLLQLKDRRFGRTNLALFGPK